MMGFPFEQTSNNSFKVEEDVFGVFVTKGELNEAE